MFQFGTECSSIRVKSVADAGNVGSRLTTNKKTRTLFAALTLALLTSAAALMLFANAGTQNLTVLSEPVKLNTELPSGTGYNVYQLTDSSIVLNSANQSGTYLTKLDTNSKIVWTRLIHAGPEPLMRLVALRDGGFLLGGIVGQRYVLARADVDGYVMWTKTVDSGANVNYLMDVAEADDGGFVLAAFGVPEIDGLGWIWYAKTDFAGNLLWSKNIHGPTNDCPSHLIPAEDDGFVLSDTAYSFVPDQAFFRLIHIDRNGQVLRNSSYGGYGYYYQPECNSAIKTVDDGYLMLGYLWLKAAWTVKVDADGAMQWNQTYGGSRDAITGALETPTGYLLQEYLDGNGTGIILTDTGGNEVWNASWMDVTMPVGMEANFHSLIEAQDGGYIMVASKDSTVWLVKLDYPREQAVWLWGSAWVLLAAAAGSSITTFLCNKNSGRRGFCRFPDKANNAAYQRNQKEH